MKPELFGEIIGEEVETFTWIPDIKDVYEEGISYTSIDGEGKFIDIFKFMHKCKIWALDLPYNRCIASYEDDEGGKALIDNNEVLKFEANRETEAVIKAVMWIVNNQEVV